MEDEPAVCSICAENLDEERNVVVLDDCGHSFHGECIVQWFRGGQASCPNCRSLGADFSWSYISPARRVGILKRRRHLLPAAMQRKLQALTAAAARLRELKRQRRELRTAHNEAFRKDQRLLVSIHRAAHRHDELHDQISYHASEHVPFMEHVEEEEEDDDDDVDDGGGVDDGAVGIA